MNTTDTNTDSASNDNSAGNITKVTSIARAVLAYDPKKSKANPDEVLVKITYKTVNDKSSPFYNVKRESKCVSLPRIPQEEIASNIAVLMPYVRDMLLTVQGKIIREALDDGAKSIDLASVNLQSCVEYLEASDESGRLTKETVFAWFDEIVVMELVPALTNKMGLGHIDKLSEAQTKAICTLSDNFRGLFGSLAGGKANYQVDVCKQLLKVLAMVDDSDTLKHRFTARLDKMIAAADTPLDILTAL